NEFKAICDDLDLEVENVIKLANRHPRVNVLRPGIGVGGHCIPVDPWFLKEIAPYNSRLITVARMINDEMPERIAAKIRKKVSRLVNPKILLLGATYKRNCEDIRESPAIHIAKILCEEGYNIEHYDPLVPGMGSTALDKTILNSDFVAVLVSHDLIKQEVERIQSICQGLPEIVFFD
ncbi:MAG: UDP binding domain-containing protein, partial [Sphaerospermopsis kisseleviana]